MDSLTDAVTAVSAMCKLHNIATERRAGMNQRGRLMNDHYGTTRTRGDQYGSEWAEWGSLGDDTGGLNVAPEDRPRPPRKKNAQRLRDVLRDRIAEAGWTRPDRSTYRGYRSAEPRAEPRS